MMMSDFQTYLQENVIDYKLAAKLKEYIDYVYLEKKEHNSIENIAGNLSKTLKQELLYQSNLANLHTIPILSNFSEFSQRRLVNEMKEIRFLPGDIIYKQHNQDDTCLYIINKGEIELYLENGKEMTVFKTLLQGECFGEISFISDSYRETSLLLSHI